MNKVYIILATVVGLFIASQLLMSYYSSDIEMPKYTVLKKYDNFEIRQYESMIVAQTTTPANTYKKSANMGFRRIAGYIFGNNKQKQEIAMTAPVFMEMGEDTKMAFVMPSKYSLSELPAPNSSSVSLVQVEPKKYAVVRFSGFASDRRIKKYTEKLKQLILDNKIDAIGSYNFLGYNAPWEVFGRRNEIAVEVK
ncbi:MAG: SOUL family heme-binding protein [Crocinitomicaceae bacterium]